MSYKSRERKRRAKAAISKGREQQRRQHRDRHYLTIVKRPCSCNEPTCGRYLREGVECVYRYEPREILCVDCADHREIKYRTSLQWERVNVKNGRATQRPRRK